MNQLVPVLAVGGLISGAGVAVNVWDNRRMIRKNINEINQLAVGFEDIRVRILGTTNVTKELQAYHLHDRKKDEAWREQELAKQEAWLRQPIYRQILVPPSPDYSKIAKGGCE